MDLVNEDDTWKVVLGTTPLTDSPDSGDDSGPTATGTPETVPMTAAP